MKLRITLFSLLLPILAYSQSATNEDVLYLELSKVEKKLNSLYSYLDKKLAKSDLENLRNSQKSWIKFREDNCIFLSRSSDSSGVLENKLRIDCKIDVTRQRITELESIVKDGF